MTDHDMEMSQCVDAALSHLMTLSRLVAVIKRKVSILQRPMIGGLFGNGQFSLCSYATQENGLHGVSYFVQDPVSGFILSGGVDKKAAIATARSLLANCPPAKLHAQIDAYRSEVLAEKAKARAAEETFPATQKRTATIRSIPRRRRQIFEASEGKCHYCSTALTLDGRWHIEHKMPKALGGDNTPGNLVASCAPCNHEKRDTTEQEYRAKRAAKAAA